MSASIVSRGTEPLIVSVPHAGTEIPSDIEERLASLSLARQDADWWVDLLYGFASDLGATVIRTETSRTVVDVNRDPGGKSLYPGQATTGLCPTTTFDGAPLYKNGQAPDDAEISRRVALFYRPYHDALSAEIARLKRDHAAVVVWDAHSIRARVPRLFEGELPDLNFGTNNGASCAPKLVERLESLADQSGFTRVTNGRFKGGYITRAYGKPSENIHAVQLELSMRTYMGEQPEKLTLDNWPRPIQFDRVPPLKKLLTSLLQAAIQFAREVSR